MSLRPRPAVIVWLAGILACVAVILGTRFTTDMSAFLPRSPSPTQRILVDQVKTGAASRLILMALEGAPSPTLATLSTRLGQQLRRDQADFVTVDNGGQAALGSAADHALLWRYRYVLSPAVAPDRFTVDGLRQALAKDLEILGSDMGGLVKESLPADPTGEILAVAQQFAGQKQPARHDGVWFSPDGRRALLVAQTRQPGFDIAPEEKVLATIARTFAAVRHSVAGAEGARLRLTGPGVFAVHTKDEMKSDISRLSLIATVLVSAILLFTYRSPRILVLALVPVASGALAGIAAVSLGFGFVHGITLGFGVTLIGEAVDYAIYLFTQTAPGTPPEATLPRIWPMLRLGVLVSVCGFSAMLFSSFTGFAQLGLFSITGLLVAVAVTRWVLPGLLARDFASRRSSLFAPALLVVVNHARALRLPLVLALAGAAVLLALHRGGFWQSDLTSLSPIPTADQQLDRTLRADIGAPDVRYLVIATAQGEQPALAASERLSAVLNGQVDRHRIAGYDAPTRYLPSTAAQRARLAALPDPDTLRARLDQASQGMPFQPHLFDPFVTAVATAKAQPLLDRAALQGTHFALKLDSLLVGRAGAWTALLPLRDVTDAAGIAAAIDRAGVPGAQFVDLKAASDRLLQTYQHEAMMLTVIGSLVIVALLAVSLRSPRRVVRVVAPLAGAVILTTAIVTAGDHKLSIFNLVGLLLTVAVGSNYCIFFECQDWRDAGAERMLASLVLANCCTIIGFGILSFARMPVLHGIGMTVAIGAFLSLVLAAIVTSRGHAAAGAMEGGTGP